MDLKDFDYELPEELIAQDPLEDRSASRLMVLDKHSGKTEHSVFKNIVNYLRQGDCLVINDTKVIPARLLGQKASGAHVEVFLLKRHEDDCWECLVKPGKKLKKGETALFGDGRLKAEILDDGNEDGIRTVRFLYEGIFEEVLDSLGEMPTPPYIRHKLKDKDRYQTVYAKNEGSVAAPTAGLHFTKELLQQIEDMGVSVVRVTLHVGLGTFRPVKCERIEDHHMHEEFYTVSEEAAARVNAARAAGQRIVAVGTTSSRTLESAAVPDGKGGWKLQAGSAWTGIYIYPGYEWKMVDALITNFHLPQSTLIMLVSALAGREHVLAAYKEAIDMRYRVFSFGDAMFIQ